MKSQHITVRLSDGERAQIMASAKKLDVTRSTLARSLLTVPIELLDIETSDEEEERIVGLSKSQTILMFDKATFRRLHMQLRRWGHHYNQAVHALNNIAAKRFMSQEDTEQLMMKSISLLEDIENMREGLEHELHRLEPLPKVRIGSAISHEFSQE